VVSDDDATVYIGKTDETLTGFAVSSGKQTFEYQPGGCFKGKGQMVR